MSFAQSTIDATSDSDLLLMVAGGDRAAFSALYDRLAGRVLGLVRKTLVDTEQSEEVTQEVFLDLWQNASRFDPKRGRASSWILTAAHRRAVDRVRASQSSRNRDLAVGIRDFRPEFDSTYEAAEITMEYRRVEAAMSRITKLQRQAVQLSFHQGRTNSEIAALLDLPVGTIKTRLRDGLIGLRHELRVTLSTVG